jgi:hypothetical protein
MHALGIRVEMHADWDRSNAERMPLMPELAPADAVRTLTEKVRAMDLDDLRDAHNELFPQTPIPPIKLSSEGVGVRQKVLAYLAGDVAVEEIIDLWCAIFPEAWNVYYDDEAGTIHYLVESESIQQAD